MSPIRPQPRLHGNNQSFISKKMRTSTPCNKKAPPRPCKSVASVRRFFTQPLLPDKPHPISFREDNLTTSDLDYGYDESRQESYFDQMFDIERKIGSGYFGDVFKVRSRVDRRYYAVKKSREAFKGKSDRDRKLQEVAKHEQLPKHPNLVEFFKAWEEKQRLYIQIELCDSSLADFMDKYHDIPESMIWSFFTDCLMALQHLHSHDLIHLDIKPENIFLSHGICKLGDFGLVVDLSRPELVSDATEGDPKYMAKELMQGKFTTAADIFSLGITFLELSCDIELPSGGEGFHALRSGDITFTEFGSHLSDDFKQMIRSMMHPDPSSRPSASSLLSHPVVRKVAKKRILKITFVEVAKKLRNFFLIILHFLSFIFFVDFIQNAMSSSDDDAGEGIQGTPAGSCPYDIPQIDLDQSFSDDEDVGLKPLTSSFESSFKSMHDRSDLHFPDRTFNRSQYLLKKSLQSTIRCSVTGSPTTESSPMKRRTELNHSSTSFLVDDEIRGSSVRFDRRLQEFSDSEDEQMNSSFSEHSIGPKNLLTVSLNYEFLLTIKFNVDLSFSPGLRAVDR